MSVLDAHGQPTVEWTNSVSHLIEFFALPGNTEVSLLERRDDGGTLLADRFYTSATQLTIAALVVRGAYQRVDPKSLFAVLEDQLPEPKIEGEFSQLSPYWEERRRVRLRRIHA